ncbi:lactonase family protein [Calidifontibacter terrae]
MAELVLVANAGDGTISTLLLRRDGRPRLELLATSPVGSGCSTFAVDVERDLVHAGYKGDPPGIVTLRLDRASGALTEVARRDVEGSLTYLSLTPDASALLGASYGGGCGASWPIVGGRPAAQRSRVEFANLHCVVVRDGRAYFVSLGDDLIAQYDLAADGTLTPLDPPTVAVAKGSGPRHLVFQGSNGYLITEFSGEVIRFTVGSDGALTPHESVSIVDPSAGLQHSRFGADPRAEHLIWGADVHPAGPWLIASERSASTLTTVARDADGGLGSVTGFVETQKQPRGFAVSGDGAFVVAVGELSTDAELFSVGSGGALTSHGTVGIGAGANWVRIIAD